MPVALRLISESGQSVRMSGVEDERQNSMRTSKE